MKIKVLKSKIHTVKVTQADLNYEGSITIDEDIMDAGKMYKYELLHINCKTNGARIQTYVMPGERGSGIVSLNGAAARHIFKGDTIHLLSFCNIDVEDMDKHTPIVAFTENNKVIQVKNYE